MRRIIFLVIFCFSGCANNYMNKGIVNLSEIHIKGKVNYSDGKPLNGLNIYIEGIIIPESYFGVMCDLGLERYVLSRFDTIPCNEMERLKTILKTDMPLYSFISKWQTEKIAEATIDTNGNYEINITKEVIKSLQGYNSEGSPKFSFLRVVFQKENFVIIDSEGNVTSSLLLLPFCEDYLTEFQIVKMKKK